MRVKRWVAPGGWDIELIMLNDTQTLRARRDGFLHGYCKSVSELEKLLRQANLTTADLVEVLPTSARRAPRG